MGAPQLVEASGPQRRDVPQGAVARDDERGHPLALSDLEPLAPQRLEQRLAGRVERVRRIRDHAPAGGEVAAAGCGPGPTAGTTARISLTSRSSRNCPKRR